MAGQTADDSNPLGPMQVLVVAFDDLGQLRGRLLEELKRLDDESGVRLVDLLVVRRDQAGGSRSCSATRQAMGRRRSERSSAASSARPSSAPERTPRRPASSSTRKKAPSRQTCGTWPTPSRAARRQPSPCSSTAGRCRSGPRSSTPAAASSARSGSIRPTSSLQQERTGASRGEPDSRWPVGQPRRHDRRQERSWKTHVSHASPSTSSRCASQPGADGRAGA